MLNNRGGHDKKINELKVKYEEQNEKTEMAKENAGVYE